MTLNYDGNNQAQCNILKNTRVKKGIRVVECATANCKKPEDANQVLVHVLDYLAKNLVRLDGLYMSACRKNLKALKNDVNVELEKARKALDQYGEEYSEYRKLCDQFIEDLYNRIEELREQIRKEPNKPDHHFQDQVDAAIEKCKTDPGIPSEAEIQTQANQDGINAAYFWGIQKIRAKLL